jgi:hypothetical protein
MAAGRRHDAPRMPPRLPRIDQDDTRMTPGCTQRGLSWQRSRKRTKTSFNVVVWNPCSLIQAGRANDTSCGLFGTYIVLLPGTRVRGLDDC